MPLDLTGGATLQCSFGAAPGTLMVTPEKKVVENMPNANIMDNVPMKNVLSFGMCSCPANPMVAAATAAAMGALTPQACIPATAAPWTPGKPTVLIANMPIINNTSKVMCSYGGVIQVVSPGQAPVQD